jgi:two-component system response regulator FixJ
MSEAGSDSIVHVVDGDPTTLARVAELLRVAGYTVRTFATAGELIAHLESGAAGGCIVAELRMPDMTGFALQEALAQKNLSLPIIFLTGHGDIPAAVRAMRQGAEDFLTRDAAPEDLLGAVHHALERDSRQRTERVRLSEIRLRMSSLTPREREVLEHVLQGQRNKQIARELDIHERTVKLHRTHIASKLRVQSVAVMTRLAQEAGALPERPPLRPLPDLGPGRASPSPKIIKY